MPGCARTLVTSFEEAQRRATRLGKAVFVFYGSWESTECGAMKAAIQTGMVQQHLNDKVTCDLDEIWEPNQQFVAQYGVDRFPAVVVIHRDGTYHSHVGKLNAEQLVAFLEQATPPGRSPMANPQIARKVDYHWIGDFERAVAQAKGAQRPLFVFYKSVISPESNDMLFNVLDHPQVAGMFEHTVNAMLDWGHAPNRRFMARYGITNVPGVLVIYPDGRYLAHQGRMTGAQLAAFVRQAKSASDPPAGDP